MISITEERKFLLTQHKVGQCGKMGGIDKVLEKRERNVYIREQDFKEEWRKKSRKVEKVIL